MKEDFLTIPDAPNYEINSELICRNKKTRKLLKGCTLPRKNIYFRLNSLICRSATTLRAQAEAYISNEQWFPVPSLNNKYEISQNGKLRNSKSKRILSPNERSYDVWIDHKQVTVTADKIFFEIFGTCRFLNRKRYFPCIVHVGEDKFFFPHFNEAAAFIAEKRFYTQDTVRRLLTKRCPAIYDFKISYFDEEAVNHV